MLVYLVVVLTCAFVLVNARDVIIGEHLHLRTLATASSDVSNCKYTHMYMYMYVALSVAIVI